MTLFSAFDAVTSRIRVGRDYVVPRQVDSGAAKRLPEGAESADVGAMSNAPSATPTNLEAALALLAAPIAEAIRPVRLSPTW